MLYSTERDLMSDHDATQPPTSGSPRPNQGDEFNARTVLINQDMLDAARAEQQTPGQAPGAVPGAVPGAQAGSWRPAQPDLPAGPPPEEQTRAFSAGAAQAAAQPGAAPADPYIQASPFAQQSGAAQPAPYNPPTQFGQSDSTGSGGLGTAQPGAASADPYAQASPFAQQSGAAQPAPYNPPAQPAWGGAPADDGAAAASSPFAQSAPGIPSAPGTSSASAAGAAPGGEASRGASQWPGQQSQGQPSGLQDQHPFAQQPAQHSHPFSGGRQDGEVGMSSVFPTATARAETEQATEAFVPDATQAVASSAPSSSAFPSQSSAPSSDAAAGQAPSFSDMVPTAAGSPFDRPAGGGALAAARSEEVETADSVGSWMLTILLAGIPLFGLVYILILAFGSGRSASKKNWARATLVWGIIAFILVLVLYAVLGSAVLAVVPSNAG